LNYAAVVATRVLLVDDVPEVRVLVRTALRLRPGFEIVGEAGDGAEAIRLAEQEQPDVVVLDLGLPDIAGREVLSQIRACSASSQVVIFSGMDPDDREWIAAQVAGYVNKDSHVDQLVDLLQTLGHGPGVEAVTELPRTPTSAGRAREFVATRLREWKLDQLVDSALVVVSELAANAVVHADSSVRIRLLLGPRTLRIEVIDHGVGTPEPQPKSTTEEHGRGLLLVSALSRAWGIDHGPGDGKTVWAEMELRGGSSAAS
jgi:DNA-binding NarL/FixJ family response regulator